MKSNLIWLIAYLVMMAVLVGGAFAARSWALTSYDQPTSRDEWNDWREETQRLSHKPGPVLRRAAKSDEPPTIVLMRDHFASTLGLLLLLSSVLFATLMFMIRGVAGGAPLVIDVDDDPPVGVPPRQS